MQRTQGIRALLNVALALDQALARRARQPVALVMASHLDPRAVHVRHGVGKR